jgi:hypothetical protein
VLEAAHGLSFDLCRASGRDETVLGLFFRGTGQAVFVAVVDDDFEAIAEVLEAVDDLGLVEIIGDDADLCLRIGNGLIEEAQA